MLKIGVIGYGYWGPNLVRNFFSNTSCEVVAVADLKPARLASLKKQYPSISVTANPPSIIKDYSIEAVVIATPAVSHFSLAKKALMQRKHVLVEKPMTLTLSQAKELISLAKKQKRVLMVDHTYLYTDAVQKIKKLIQTNEIGKLRYFDSTRTNLGIFQQDINVLWDLAAHDVSILSYLIDEKPQTIQASGVSHTKNRIVNIAFITIKYPSGLVAHFNCSWSSPVKIRRILIGGTKKMIVYDDVEPTEKIKVYDSGYAFKKNKDTATWMVDYRSGDIHIPKIELQEALIWVVKDFIDSIARGKKPIADSDLGLEVVKILTLAQKSMKSGERPVRYR